MPPALCQRPAVLTSQRRDAAVLPVQRHVAFEPRVRHLQGGPYGSRVKRCQCRNTAPKQDIKQLVNAERSPLAQACSCLAVRAPGGNLQGLWTSGLYPLRPTPTCTSHGSSNRMRRSVAPWLLSVSSSIWELRGAGVGTGESEVWWAWVCAATWQRVTCSYNAHMSACVRHAYIPKSKCPAPPTLPCPAACPAPPAAS